MPGQPGAAAPSRRPGLGRVDVGQPQWPRPTPRPGTTRRRRPRPRSGWACARTGRAFTGAPSPGPGGRPAEAARGAAGGLLPVLDQPAPLAGDRGQAGLGVHRHREADHLEHRQVGSSRRRPPPRPGRGPRRRRSRAATEPGSRRSAARRAPARCSVPSSTAIVAHTMSSNSGRSGHHEVEGAGDEHGAVAEGAVLAHPADRGRERLGEDQVLTAARPSPRRIWSTGASS